MADSDGYILRIATKQWVDQVFDTASYYTGLHRKWKQGQTIIFMHKTKRGDAAVGYGVVDKVHDKDDLSVEEKLECEKHGWTRALEFSYVMKFEKPLLVKETFLKDTKLRGRYFHGSSLSGKNIQRLISQAEQPPH